MAQTQRTYRVADLLQRELAIILQQELADPRLGFLTVTGVDISPDLTNASVYVSCLSLNEAESEKTPAQQIDILQNSVGFVRRLLGQRVQLRTIPRLQFIYDDTTVRANQLSDVIDSVITPADDVCDSE